MIKANARDLEDCKLRNRKIRFKNYGNFEMYEFNAFDSWWRQDPHPRVWRWLICYMKPDEISWQNHGSNGVGMTEVEDLGCSIQ